MKITGFDGQINLTWTNFLLINNTYYKGDLAHHYEWPISLRYTEYIRDLKSRGLMGTQAFT
jgi:hypothetical protein